MEKIINITSKAVSFMKTMVDEKNCLGMRIDVVQGGCHGMSYQVDFVNEVNPTDLIMEEDGLKLYIAPEAVLFISGMTMDYVSTPTGCNFVFDNPNAKSRCGCGKSFCFSGSEKQCGGKCCS